MSDIIFWVLFFYKKDIDNLTYIKIRDFERLNYNIEYVDGQQYNTVIITKK